MHGSGSGPSATIGLGVLDMAMVMTTSARKGIISFLMNYLLQIGGLLYVIVSGVQFFLVGTLVIRRDYRRMPAFFVYAVFCVVRSSILFPLYFSASPNQYAFAYWAMRAAGFIFVSAVAGELLELTLRWPGSTYVCTFGGVVFASYFVRVRDTVAGESFGLLLAGLCVLVMFGGQDRRVRETAHGLFVSAVFTAAVQFSSLWLPIVNDITRYTPTLSFFAAQMIWVASVLSSAPAPAVDPSRTSTNRDTSPRGGASGHHSKVVRITA